MQLHGPVVSAYYKGKVVGGGTSILGALRDAVTHPERAKPGWRYQ